MSKFLESLYLDATFVQRLEGKRIQPIEHRDCVGILLVENDLNLRQSCFPYVRNIANAGQVFFLDLMLSKDETPGGGESLIR